MTTNHHTAYIDGTTEYKAAHMNPPLAALDRAITALAQLTIEDRATTPPGSPAAGATYLIIATATGDWASKEGQIAHYNDSQWNYWTPEDGWLAWVKDEDLLYYYNGSAWVEYASTPPSHTHTESDITDLDDDFIVAGSFIGLPGDGATLLYLPFTKSIQFPSGLTGSQFKAGTAATAQAVFSIKKNGVECGTATFAASGTTATLAMSSATTFAAGDVVTIVAPATADTTLADLGWGLVGTK